MYRAGGPASVDRRPSSSSFVNTHRRNEVDKGWTRLQGRYIYIYIILYNIAHRWLLNEQARYASSIYWRVSSKSLFYNARLYYYKVDYYYTTRRSQQQCIDKLSTTTTTTSSIYAKCFPHCVLHNVYFTELMIVDIALAAQHPPKCFPQREMKRGITFNYAIYIHISMHRYVYVYADVNGEWIALLCVSHTPNLVLIAN